MIEACRTVRDVRQLGANADPQDHRSFVVPHTPLIWYSSGLSVWLFWMTLITEKSSVT